MRRGRGGICYEQNLLLAEALRYLGFAVRYVAARNLAAGAALPRTHMALQVTLGHERWLCDVGFGVAGLLNPVSFGASTANATHRIERVSENAFHLQVVTSDGWNDLYEFSTGTVTIEDLHVMHFYISRHPASRFLENTSQPSCMPSGGSHCEGIA